MRVGLDVRAARRGLGIATFAAALAERLADTPGIDLVAFGPPAEPLDPLRPRWPPALRAYPALDGPAGRRAAQRAGLDVMHFTANSGWGRPGPVPFVLTVHDAIFAAPDRARSLRQRAGHRYWKANARRAVRAAAAVVSPTRAAADAVQEALGLPETPLVIPNGVASRPVALPLAPGPPYVLGFGGRDPRKRVDLVVAGWRASGTDAALHLLCGAGLAPGLEAEIAGDVASGRLHLLPYLPRGELERELAGARALLYPSEAEGFGLPVLEAMALGVPVVTGLCAATREVGGDAVLVIDPGDPAGAMGAAVRRLESDPGLRRRCAAAGRERALRYDWAATSDAYRELYARVVAA